jgi:hypothetical protein
LNFDLDFAVGTVRLKDFASMSEPVSFRNCKSVTCSPNKRCPKPEPPLKPPQIRSCRR